MWLSPGTQYAIIAHGFKRPTSEARYGAILLYFQRNIERGDHKALSDARRRLPDDLAIDDNGLIFRTKE